jgi:putative membrane protein
MLLASGASFAADDKCQAGPKPGSNTEAVSKVEDATAGLVGTISAHMTSTTEGFVTAAAIGDMYEVEAGKLAAQRASSPAVKDFGQRMVKAHTENTAKLKGIIASNNIKVTPPAELDARRKGMLDNLRGASAADFDNRYITQQVAAHKEADILMRGYAEDGDNAAIRNFAAETGKHVRMHLSMAEKLDAKQMASQ